MTTVIENCRIAESVARGRFEIRETDLVIASDGRLEAAANTTPDRRYDANGALVLPAFRNLHIHLGESMYAGCRASSLQAYLELTAARERALDRTESERAWKASAEWTAQQTLHTGTVTTVGARTAIDTLCARARTVSLLPIMESAKLSRFYAYTDVDVESWLDQQKQRGAQTGFFVQSCERVSDEWLGRIRAARQRAADLWFSAHVAETEASVLATHRRWGRGSVQVLDEHHLLTSRSILVHGGHLTSDELDVVQQRGSAIALCPVSNWRLGTVPPSLAALFRHEIPIAIASDGVGTAGSVDLLTHARLSGPILETDDPHLLLSLVTTRPAAILGEAPAFECGTSADYTFWMSSGTWCPDPLEELLWGASFECVGVLLRGQFIWGRPPLAVREQGAVPMEVPS